MSTYAVTHFSLAGGIEYERQDHLPSYQILGASGKALRGDRCGSGGIHPASAAHGEPQNLSKAYRA